MATARELAASALSVLKSDPELSILLALEGLEATGEPQREVLEALHAALQNDRLLNRVSWPADRPGGVMMGVAVAEDGSTFATSADGVTIDLWQIATGEHIETIGGLDWTASSFPRSPGRCSTGTAPESLHLARTGYCGSGIWIQAARGRCRLMTPVPGKRSSAQMAAYSQQLHNEAVRSQQQLSYVFGTLTPLSSYS